MLGISSQHEPIELNNQRTSEPLANRIIKLPRRLNQHERLPVRTNLRNSRKPLVNRLKQRPDRISAGIPSTILIRRDLVHPPYDRQRAQTRRQRPDVGSFHRFLGDEEGDATLCVRL